MNRRGGEFATRLVWQNLSPAPFESGWSIFIKLLCLNQNSASLIARMLSNDRYRKQRIDYLDSDWIDFDAFGNALSVTPYRLKQGFLDQLGLYSPKSSLKLCNACLVHGYNNVLFSLKFVTHCPWHRLELISCTSCSQLMMVNNLRFDGNVFSSKCSHIQCSLADNLRSNELSEQQQLTLKVYTQELLCWLWKLRDSNLVQSLLDSEPESRWSNSDVLFSAAESIAGPCPWPTSHKIRNVKCIVWKQPIEPFSQDYRDLPSLKFKEIFKSIRRAVFKRYIKSHKRCFNELTSYSRNSMFDLNTQSVCPVALAYVSWIMAAEGVYYVQALKYKIVKSLQKHYQSSQPNFKIIPHSFATMFIQEFFTLWAEIIENMGKGTFEIITSSTLNYSAMFLDRSHIVLNADNSGSWMVLFPDPQPLETKSYCLCSGVRKTKGWMTNSPHSSTKKDHAYHFWNSRHPFSETLFKVHQFEDKETLFGAGIVSQKTSKFIYI